MEPTPPRVKIRIAWISVAVSVVVVIGLLVAFQGNLLIGKNDLAESKAPAIRSKDKKKPPSGFEFDGGPFESSGVVSVPGTDAVLFVDDGRVREIYWMQLDGSGRQKGAIKSVPLGIEIDDPEDITTDGKYFYIVGSNTREAEKRFGLARLAFDSSTNQVTASPIPNLRTLLLERVQDLKEAGTNKAKDDGLNIEGIAWDPAGHRLLLGLRSPLSTNLALIVPIGVRDPAAPFTVENLSFNDSPTIKLPLDGLGIRSIQYDWKSKTYLIIGGATEMQGKGEFSLWRWDGRDKVTRVAMLDPEMKPEGVTRVRVGNADFVLVVGDSNRYIRVEDIE
jgi:Protein of unknown function (DUF3616)